MIQTNVAALRAAPHMAVAPPRTVVSSARLAARRPLISGEWGTWLRLSMLLHTASCQ